MTPAESAIAAARRLSWLFVIAGVLALVGNHLPDAPPHDQGAVQWLGLVDVGIGVVFRLLPWGRWSARWTLVAAPVAFVLIGQFQRSGALSSFSYASFFIVVFVWIGLSHPPRTSFLIAPLAAILYVLPLRGSGQPAAAAQSVTIALPVCLMVAETAARTVGRLHRSMEELARVNAESEHRAGLLAAVTRAARSMSRLDAEAVLEEVLEAAGELGLDLTWVVNFDDGAQTFGVVHVHGHFPAPHEPIELLGTGLPAAVRSKGGSLCIENFSVHPLSPDAATQAGLRTMLATPVRSETRIVAVLCAASTEPISFGVEDIEAFELLAAHAGVALANARSFEAQRRHAVQLDAAARRDDLTGIGNRRHAQVLLDSVAVGDALLVFDLDGFKQVNDTYGHAAGDQLLGRLGQYLRSNVRGTDDVARLGGDEFLVRFPAEVDGLVAARRLLAVWCQGNPEVLASGGLAFHQPGHSPTDTLQRADAALYAAKRRSRGRLEIDGRCEAEDLVAARD